MAVWPDSEVARAAGLQMDARDRELVTGAEIDAGAEIAAGAEIDAGVVAGTVSDSLEVVYIANLSFECCGAVAKSTVSNSPRLISLFDSPRKSVKVRTSVPIVANIIYTIISTINSIIKNP